MTLLSVNMSECPRSPAPAIRRRKARKTRRMRVDHYSYGMPTRDIATSVRALEEVGVDGWFTAEAGFDPVVPATIAAAHSDRIAVGTGILIAFARAPMTTAYLAHGLQEAAEGRFLLGIGSQIKAHVERR